MTDLNEFDAEFFLPIYRKRNPLPIETHLFQKLTQLDIVKVNRQTEFF